MHILVSLLRGTPFSPRYFHIGTRIYLILFSAHAFAIDRQHSTSKLLSLLVFRAISTDFTPTPHVLLASYSL